MEKMKVDQYGLLLNVKIFHKKARVAQHLD